MFIPSPVLNTWISVLSSNNHRHQRHQYISKEIRLIPVGCLNLIYFSIKQLSAKLSGIMLYVHSCKYISNNRQHGKLMDLLHVSIVSNCCTWRWCWFVILSYIQDFTTIAIVRTTIVSILYWVFSVTSKRLKCKVNIQRLSDYQIDIIQHHKVAVTTGSRQIIKEESDYD